MVRKKSKSGDGSGKKRTYSIWNIWIITVFLKLLISVGYYSTDFEVHRNWLALTHNLPLKKWYSENTSEWTLDYPPFFAYFEWLLSQLVPPMVKEDGCLDVVEKGSFGFPTVMFQRLTVLASELVLIGALQWYISTNKEGKDQKRAYAIATSLTLSPGILMIDHIHFQYNGMLMGMLVLVVNCARLQKYLLMGFWFSVLICFKHIFIYLAPAVFIFLLRVYCLNLQSKSILGLIRWKNSAKLGSVVLAVFGIAFLPFIWYGMIPQLISRLFPFQRGLTHAYWAPNIWALYSLADRLLLILYRRAPISRMILERIFKVNWLSLTVSEEVASLTRGLVGDSTTAILPEITPKLTFLLTAFYQLMALGPLFMQPNFNRFVGALSLCGYASFLFGWHVHEKAILLVIFPVSFIAVRDKSLLGPFNLLVSCGYVSLFPLIFTPQEWTLKVVYMIFWYIVHAFNYGNVVRLSKRYVGTSGIILDRVINGYILGLIPLVLVTTTFEVLRNKFEILKKLEFLNLIFYSVYCAVGIISSWNGFSWVYFIHEEVWE